MKWILEIKQEYRFILLIVIFSIVLGVSYWINKPDIDKEPNCNELDWEIDPIELYNHNPIYRECANKAIKEIYEKAGYTGN